MGKPKKKTSFNKFLDKFKGKEYKSIEIDNTGGSALVIPTTGVLQLLLDASAPARGTHNSERLGNRIFVRSVRIRMDLFLPSTVPDGIIRVLLVHTDNVLTATMLPDVYDDRNHYTVANSPDEYKVLWDMTYNVRQLIAAQTSQVFKHKNIKVNRYISFRDSDVAGNWKNSLYMYFVSDNALIQTEHKITISYQEDE